MDVTEVYLDSLLADANIIMHEDGIADQSCSKVISHIKRYLSQPLDQIKKLRKKNAEQEAIISQQKNLISQKDQTISDLSAAVRNLSNPSSHPPCIEGADPITEVEAKDTETDCNYGYLMPNKLDNMIFRTQFNDQELDLQKLWHWINNHFMKRLTYKYDWFALWRILKDKGLIRNRMVSTRDFVKQMTAWFVNQAQECICNDGNVNLYRSGYLGKTEYSNWCREKFEEQLDKKPKQRIEGFDRLSDLCAEMTQDFKISSLFKEK